MIRLKIELLGMCETRWSGMGEMAVNGHYILWSGPDPSSTGGGPPLGQAGVALSLLTAIFNHRRGKLSVIVAYSPTNLAPDLVKDSFYNTLSSVVERISRHDLVLILTDANATLCPSARASHPDVVGRFFVDPNTNDNGERLLNFCQESNLKIIDTCFERKRIHYWTWYSNDGHTKRALDHVLVSRRWCSSITQCRVFRSAQLGNTDHRLLSLKLHLKLKAEPKTSGMQKFNLDKLKDPEIKFLYQVDVRNRFNALAATTNDDTEPREVENDVLDTTVSNPIDVNTAYKQLKEPVTEAAKRVLGKPARQPR